MIQVYIIYLTKLSTRDENFGKNVCGQTVLAKLSGHCMYICTRDTEFEISPVSQMLRLLLSVCCATMHQVSQ